MGKVKVFVHAHATKYEQIVKLEHLLCPKVGGGGRGAESPPFSYALVLWRCVQEFSLYHVHKVKTWWTDWHTEP